MSVEYFTCPTCPRLFKTKEQGFHIVQGKYFRSLCKACHNKRAWDLRRGLIKKEIKTEQQCKDCGLTVPLDTAKDFFAINWKTGKPRSHCRKCTNLRSKERYDRVVKVHKIHNPPVKLSAKERSEIRKNKIRAVFKEWQETGILKDIE